MPAGGILESQTQKTALSVVFACREDRQSREKRHNNAIQIVSGYVVKHGLKGLNNLSIQFE
jgi:hypothetical protein